MAETHRPIRVMRLIARMNVGGPAVQVSGLMRRLDAVEFEHRLITGYCEDDEADYLQTQAPDITAARVEGLGRSVSILDDLRAFRAIRAAIKEFKPDIVHTHTAKAGVLGRLAVWTVLPRPKVVHTYHGHLLHGYFGKLGTWIVVAIERLMSHMTDVLVAVGPEVRDDLLRAGIGRAEQYRVVEPGLSLAEYPSRAEARTTLGLPAHTPVVSVLGRITSIKRPDRALDVIATTCAHLPELQVIVAGDGDLRHEMQKNAEDRRLPVKFLGWRSDVERVLAASDVTLLTSDNEGTPLSLIQAAMLGVPCVATDVGSVGHIVHDGETGWVTPAEVDALGQALKAALTDLVETRRRGHNATAWAAEHFSVERLVADYAAIYQELARS